MHELFKQKNLPYLNVKECPNCHQSIPINSNVCPSCNYDLTIISIKKEEKVDDTKLSQQAEAVKETISQKEEIQPLCPSCGKLINPKKDFCPYCGFKLKVDRCLCCGSFLADDVLYCPNCGTKRGSSGNPTIGQKLKTDDESDTEIIKKLSSDNVENNSTHEEEPVIETEEIKEPQVEEPNEEKTQPDFNIKKKKYLSKKRIFLLFVLIFILGSIAVLLFTNYIYINSFIYNNETFIVKENSLNGIYIIKTFINDLINQKVLVNNHYLIEFTTNNTSLQSLEIFSSGWPTIISSYSGYAICLMYIIILFFSFIALISNFIAMLTKNKFKTKSLGFLVFLYFIFTILTVTHIVFLYLTGNFNWLDFNSFNIITFVVLFFVWLVIKLSFMKNNKDIDLLKSLMQK